MSPHAHASEYGAAPEHRRGQSKQGQLGLEPGIVFHDHPEGKTDNRKASEDRQATAEKYSEKNSEGAHAAGMIRRANYLNSTMRIITARRTEPTRTPRRFPGLLLSALALGGASLALATSDESPEPLRIADSHRDTARGVVLYSERKHYEQIEVDDSLSEAALRRFIDLLDGQRLYFLRNQEAYFLRIYGDRLDDAMRLGQLDPIFDIYRLFRKRMTSYFDFALEYMDTEPNLNTDRAWILDREETPRPASHAEMEDLWRNRVRHELINLVLDDRSYEEAVEALRKRYDRQRKSLFGQDSDDVFAAYMNAFTRTLDPHSNYFSPNNFEEYRIQMSRAYYGVGASLGIVDDYVLVQEVLSGGPAEQDGRLRAGDRITGVDGSAGGELIDVVGWPLDDVVELIRGPADTPVVLRILPGGEAAGSDSFLLELTRGRVRLQGAEKELLTTERNGENVNVGVIRIANFYFDMEGRDAGLEDYPSSTRDVKRLIEELKSEGAESLILDLRHNGGGHLSEAISLAGLFVGKGPVVQVRETGERPQVLPNRVQPPVWDGPLVVLVDRLSASASEILAAAIQDYGRGVVVGQRTFGKGTVQHIFSIRRRGEPMPGRLTLTIGKYYRVTGESTQHRGVSPDITLPAAVATLPDRLITEEIGESASENALPWDTIRKTNFPGQTVDGATLTLLTANHEKRESEDSDWRMLLSRIKAIQEMTERESEPIHLDRRREDQAMRRAQRLAMTNEWLQENDLPAIESLEELREMDLPDVALEQASEVAADLVRLQVASTSPPAAANSSLQ